MNGFPIKDFGYDVLYKVMELPFPNLADDIHGYQDILNVGGAYWPRLLLIFVLVEANRPLLAIRIKINKQGKQ